jgi:hypothetical protein
MQTNTRQREQNMAEVGYVRLCSFALLLAVVGGCHRPREVSGIYVDQDSTGTLFPCSDTKITIVVKNVSLSAQYAAAAQPNQPMFVRLRGVEGHEGSIYGGQRYLDVQQILELRPRAARDCPGVLQPSTTIVH